MIWPWLLHSLLHDKVAVAIDHLHAYQFQHKHIKQMYHCMYTVIVTCDWASKNGPSGHIKFDHIFQICCIISNYLLKVLKKNLIFTIQKQFNSQCVTACRKQILYTELKIFTILWYDAGTYFVATWSLFTGPVTFNLLRQRSQSISGQESAVSMAVPYSGKVWILSIWRKKVWRINRLANRLLLVRCNNNNNYYYTDGFSLANHGRFAKLSRYSSWNLDLVTCIPYMVYITCAGVTMVIAAICISDNYTYSIPHDIITISNELNSA